MNAMDGNSFNITEDKLNKLKEIIPEAFTEGKIDWEKLKAALGEDIEFYFKLPFWFKIKTPIGKYNPDWALIKKNEKTVFFVAETKSKGQELRTSEERKIKCGQAHFKEFDDIKYRQVATVGELDYE